MKKKELKKHIKELQEKLNLANKTVKLQIDEIKSMEKETLETLGSFSEMYESQLEIQDNEIRRLNTIIHYLETKCLKVYDEQ